jgi:hypothetical protein
VRFYLIGDISYIKKSVPGKRCAESKLRPGLVGELLCISAESAVKCDLYLVRPLRDILGEHDLLKFDLWFVDPGRSWLIPSR